MSVFPALLVSVLFPFGNRYKKEICPHAHYPVLQVISELTSLSNLILIHVIQNRIMAP